jgi:hypothetical protein
VQRWRVAADLAAVPQPGRPPKLTGGQATEVACRGWRGARRRSGSRPSGGPRRGSPSWSRRGWAWRDAPAVPQPLAAAARRPHAADPATPGRRTGRGHDPAVAAAGLAAHQKNAADAGATLAFSDEAGFLLLPPVHTTPAPRGQTPVLPHRGPAAATRSRSRRH